MHISPVAKDIVSNMIFVSGTGRSGTTIIGKLIGTALNVEYHFEPPTLNGLGSVIVEAQKSNQLNEWQVVFETYCFEDLLLGSIAGRNLNFNENDDSYIYNIKEEEEIKRRLSASHRKYELEKEASKYRLAVKLPNFTQPLLVLEELYPDMTKVLIIRNPNEIINSFVGKGWFADIKPSSPTVFWPFRLINDLKIPAWVEENKFDWWISANEVDRIAYYIISQWSGIERLHRKYIIDYNRFLIDPAGVTNQIFDDLQLGETLKTKEVIDSITSFRPKQYDDVLKNIDSHLMAELTDLYNKLSHGNA